VPYVDYRQLIFSNIINGMRTIVDTMDIWEMRVDVDNRVRLCRRAALACGVIRH
jgi:hypothetical protein